MAQETTNNPRNDPTMSAQKYDEKLPSSTDPADNNVVSSDVDNCINNITRFEKKNDKITSQQSLQITKGIAKNIELYKMKKNYKLRYNSNIDSWRNNKGNDLHVKGGMVDFEPDVVLLHSDTNH